MSPVQTISEGAVSGNRAVHLMLTAGEARTWKENPDQVRAEIHLRADKMSRVLEKTLLEPHGVSRWGLNE